MAEKKTRERKILRSIGFTEIQLDCYNELEAQEGGSLSEHTRTAFNEYLRKKGFEI